MWLFPKTPLYESFDKLAIIRIDAYINESRINLMQLI